MYSEAIVISDDLVSDARDGNPAALSRLWETCAPILEAALRRQRAGVSSADISDLAQEAAVLFLEIVRRGPSEREAPEPFGRRYARALFWKIHDYLRSERRRRGRQTLLSDDLLERALQRRAAGERPSLPGRSVTRALEQLSPRQRAVIHGLYFQERSVGSLASELGIAPRSITTLRRRAFAVLRPILDEPSSEADPPRDEIGPNLTS